MVSIGLGCYGSNYILSFGRALLKQINVSEMCFFSRLLLALIECSSHSNGCSRETTAGLIKCLSQISHCLWPGGYYCYPFIKKRYFNKQ